MQITVYEGFAPVALIGSWLTLRYTLSLFGVGEWEGVFLPGDAGVEALARDRVVLFDNNEARAFLVERMTWICLPEGERLVVRGRQLKGLLARRLVVPPDVGLVPGDAAQREYMGWDREEGPADAVMHGYIERHATQPQDSNRRIPGLVLDACTDCGKAVSWWARYQPLDAVLGCIGQAGDMAWDVLYDRTRQEYRVRFAPLRDCTQDDDGIPAVRFSPRLEGFEQAAMIQEWMSYHNAYYFGGAGQGCERLVVLGYTDETGQPGAMVSGWQRYEAFREARGLDVPADIVAEGYRKVFSRFQPPMRLEVTPPYPGHVFVYGKEYRLGDVVWVELGDMAVQAPITGMQVTEDGVESVKLFIGGRVTVGGAPA